MIKLGIEDRHFIFTVETCGSLRPEEIVRRSIVELKKKLDHLRKQVQPDESMEVNR